MKEEFTSDRVKRLKKDKDYYNLFRYCQYHAKGSNLDAIYELGNCYRHGWGCDQSELHAHLIYTELTRLGYVPAISAMAWDYYEGKGVGQSYKRAFRFFKEACQYNDQDAMFNIALMYFNGTGIESDKKLAVHYFEKAAVLGHARSQFNLGVCYHKGWGVSKDLVKAHYWLSQAANQGYHKAGEYLGQLPSYYVVEDLERVSEQLESIEQEIDGPVEADKIIRKIRRILDHIEEETKNGN